MTARNSLETRVLYGAGMPDRPPFTHPLCLVGVHQFEWPPTPVAGRAADLVPGQYLKCTRCRKSRVVYVDTDAPWHRPSDGVGR